MATQALEAELRQTFYRVALVHRAHHVEADGLTRTFNRLTLAQIVLSALTAGGLLGVIFGPDKQATAAVTAVIAAILFFINAYLKGLDPLKNAQRLVAAATQLRQVRDGYVSLLVDMKDNRITEQAATDRREALQMAYNGALKGGPGVDPESFDEARSQPRLVYTDAQIDADLPAVLRHT